MKSDVVSAWQKLLRRREEAAAALAAIDKEIAEVRECLALGTDWPVPPVAVTRKNPLRERQRVQPSTERPAPKPSQPAPKRARPDAGDRDRADCAAVVTALQGGPLPLRDLTRVTALPAYRVKRAAQELAKQSAIVRIGTGPANMKWQLRTAAPAKTSPRTNGSGRKDPDYDVAWSGRQSLTGGA